MEKKAINGEKEFFVPGNSRTYIAIDLKSFYASVECVERGLDPLTTNLVVADASRTEKTICLAVSPSLKKYGIPGRARLFEVVQKCKEVKMKTGEVVEYITERIPPVQYVMILSFLEKPTFSNIFVSSSTDFNVPSALNKSVNRI